ncbi:FecR domain-containing protein [Candidatus Woesearchaeota archaeon]|nr:FecR domain-containing protein [Candidatus Woesearchaeota archaeon]
MKKGKIVSLVILVIVVIIAIIAYFAITGSATRTAFLTIESGEVMVDTGKGWVPAVDDMDLGLEDKIKTGPGAEATVILYESVIVSLDADTEVMIADLSKDNLKVKQDSGSTWNKFTGISGIGDYSVETPNTVATVRGTGFGVNMQSVLVGEGEVDVKKGDVVKRIVQGRKAVLREGQLVDEELSDTDRSRIMVQMQRSLKHIKMLREREIEKKRFMLNIAQKTRGFTEEDMRDGIVKADRGELDLDELEDRAPVKMEAIRKVRAMTEEVIKINRMMQKVEIGDFSKEDLLQMRERVTERVEERVEARPEIKTATAPIPVEPLREEDRIQVREEERPAEPLMRGEEVMPVDPLGREPIQEVDSELVRR